ncbi:MAG: methylenetetrahydrofolate reductase [NAD(P)H] [Bacteroidales bacterium]
MNFIKELKQPEKTRFSFELLPPQKGSNIQSLYSIIDKLVEFDPLYINVTYHQEELVYKKRIDGLLEAKKTRKRPGTVGISAAIQYKYNIPVVPHLICGSFSKEDTENALIDLHFLGINNVLIVRGDPPENIDTFIPHKNGHKHAIGLLKQVVDLNNGIYIEDDLSHMEGTDFSIAVAGYPEKHEEAPNFESDIHYLKQKIDAGADYIVTQLFFDNEKFYRFVDECRANDINVPIIPGLKPVSQKKHLQILPKVFKVDLPYPLTKAMEKCKTNKEVQEVGIEWAIKQSEELVKFGVSNIHYYTMDRADNIYKIAKEVF